jgi:hypothetical protein
MAKAKAITEVRSQKLTKGRETLLRQPALGPYEHELLSGLRAVFKSSVTNKACPDCEGLKLCSGKFCDRCKGLGRVRATRKSP